jgi:osmotically inducible protein OsmC
LERKEFGFFISAVELETEAHVPGMDGAAFQTQAEAAKRGCPVSRALAGTVIQLKARLV